MSVECFLDTNVLVYAVSSAEHEADKSRRALELVETSDFGLSAQVLHDSPDLPARPVAAPRRNPLFSRLTCHGAGP